MLRYGIWLSYVPSQHRAHDYCFRCTNLSCARRHVISYSMYYISAIAYFMCIGAAAACPLCPYWLWRWIPSCTWRHHNGNSVVPSALSGPGSQRHEHLIGKYTRALTFQTFFIVQVDFLELCTRERDAKLFKSHFPGTFFLYTHWLLTFENLCLGVTSGEVIFVVMCILCILYVIWWSDMQHDLEG